MLVWLCYQIVGCKVDLSDGSCVNSGMNVGWVNGDDSLTSIVEAAVGWVNWWIVIILLLIYLMK